MIVDTFKFVVLLIEFWKSVSRAENYAENLRNTQHKVYELWNKEKHHRFAKMSQNSYDSKSHARKVAKCVPHKYF